GLGATASAVEIGNGGRGGDGRRGGSGGSGGGGGGGPSVGVWVEGTMRPVQEMVNYRVGAAGVGGASSAGGRAEGQRGLQANTHPMQ
ncbi:MAG: PE family protein, partial [Deltaproteobacteria bacterium]|nr:PE family protein [Deltaproteobacteria bacterium]